MYDSKAASTPLEVGSNFGKGDCPTTVEEQLKMADVPYRAAIGSLIYISQGTRPDMAEAVSCLGSFSHNPGKVH